MPTIKLTGFSGIVPKLAARQLPDSSAQIASNVKLTSGELAPYHSPSPIASQPTKPTPFLSLYHAVDDGNSAWLTWPTDVDCVRMPFDVANEARYAWTGDKCPRYGAYSNVTSGGANDYPKTSYALGIPRPQTAPGASHSGGTGSAVSRVYCYTFYNPATAEESGASPYSTLATGKVDGTWSITGMDVFPLNTGTITGAVKDTPAVGKIRITTSAAHWLRTNDEVTISGIVGLTDANGTWSVTVESATTFYIVKASTQTYTSGGSWTRTVAWNTSGMVRRLYRTSGSTASFQLVADNISATTYSDTILDANIPGDDLVSATWEPPLANMTSLRVTPSGSLVGVSENLICFSEPYQPHAWPTEYQFGCDFPLVGVGLAGTDVVGITQANPYLVTGTEPASMYAQKLPGIYPGLSKRSIVSDGSACYYASKQGFVGVQNGQINVVSNTWFTQDEWIKYNPDTMVSALYQGRFFIGYTDDDSNKNILAFDLQYQQLTTLDVSAYTLYVDETSGVMWVSTTEGLCEFDEITTRLLAMEWKSKEFVLPKPCNFGAAQVFFETSISEAETAALQAAYDAALATNTSMLSAGTMRGGFGLVAMGTVTHAGSNAEYLPSVPSDATITFTLYDGSRVIWSGAVNSTKPFRLPAGLRMDRPSVKINASGNVSYVIIAETMSELRDA